MGKVIIVPSSDFSNAGFGKIKIKNGSKTTSISINGEDSITDSGKFYVSFEPYNAIQRDIVWSIVEGNEYAEISDNGLLLVKAGASSSDVTIRASVYGTSIFADKDIVVTSTIDVKVEYIALKPQAVASPLYINTHVSVASDRRYEVEFAIDSDPTENIEICGSSASANADPFAAASNIYFVGYDSGRDVIVATNSQRNRTLPASTTIKNDTSKRFVVAIDNSNTYVYESGVEEHIISYANGTTAAVTTSEILIGAFHALNNILSSYTCKLKIYGFKVFSGSNIIANFKPAFENNLPCLIDEESGIIYNFEGRGTIYCKIGNTEKEVTI